MSRLDRRMGFSLRATNAPTDSQSQEHGKSRGHGFNKPLSANSLAPARLPQSPSRARRSMDYQAPFLSIGEATDNTEADQDRRAVYTSELLESDLNKGAIPERGPASAIPHYHSMATSIDLNDAATSSKPNAVNEDHIVFNHQAAPDQSPYRSAYRFEQLLEEICKHGPLPNNIDCRPILDVAVCDVDQDGRVVDSTVFAHDTGPTNKPRQKTSNPENQQGHSQGALGEATGKKKKKKKASRISTKSTKLQDAKSDGAGHALGIQYASSAADEGRQPFSAKETSGTTDATHNTRPKKGRTAQIRSSPISVGEHQTSPPRRKATETDAKRHRIPPGYSLKHWDPTRPPVLLLGSVFDFESLGKWIYNWTAARHGPSTPLSDIASEMRLLLTQLSEKTSHGKECLPRIRTRDDREIVVDFIESSERLTDKLRKLLRRCEAPMLGASMHRDNAQLSDGAGMAFVKTMFGREYELEMTERLMASFRLWNLRFDVNCSEILNGTEVPKSGATKEKPCPSQQDKDPYSSSPISDRSSPSPVYSYAMEDEDDNSSCFSEGSNDEILENGHPFLQALPSLVQIAINEYFQWRTRQQTQSKKGSSKPKNGKTGDGPPRQPQPQKRGRTTEEETGSGDEGHMSTKDSKRSKLRGSSDNKLTFACPYYKKDKFKYKDCLLNFRLQRIKDVKQHLCRKHIQPQFCPSCGDEFETQGAQREHVRARSCTIRDFQEPDGISEDVQRKLREKSDRKMTFEQQWYDVWDLIFPDTEPPPSVYVQDPVMEVLLSFGEFFDQHGQRLIAERLRSQHLPYDTRNEERDLGALFTTVRREATSSFIEMFNDSATSEALQNESIPSLVAADSTTPTSDSHGADQDSQRTTASEQPSPSRVNEKNPLPFSMLGTIYENNGVNDFDSFATNMSLAGNECNWIGQESALFSPFRTGHDPILGTLGEDPTMV